MKKNIFHILLSVLLSAGCSSDVSIPSDSISTKEQASIYPDYRDITIPPNIAPLNIQAKSEGTEFVISLEGKGGSLLASASEDGKIEFDSLEWRNLLKSNQGNELTVTLYALRNNKWVKHPSWSVNIAEEPIDRYLSYRLIEPSYELYRMLGLYQRDLSTFEQTAIYENNRQYQKEENHCVNCHTYQNWGSTGKSLFHVRAKHGGTVFLDGDKTYKVNMSCDSILSSTVYPSWHPSKNWIVFSSNLTGQAFHMMDKQKIEVLDYGSDLVFYDADAKTLTNILKTKDTFETFPCWSPDGKRIYYCSASVPDITQHPDSTHSDYVLTHYDSLRYNIMSLPFDGQTRRFGTPRMEVNCDSLGKSASVPRISPDGRYMLFTLGNFGQFHIWHSSSDLYIKDLKDGRIFPLTATNSNDVDSYHTWSSNGRWIVFASRRDDGSYTRVYIAYFDQNGIAHKAFLLPQEDPEQNLLLMKSYNVPELSRKAVSVPAEKLKQIIYDDNAARRVTYRRP